MEKFFLVGPRKDAQSILLHIQRVGVIQVDPLRGEDIEACRLSPEEEDILKRWEGVATSADHALRLLGLEAESRGRPFEGDLKEAEGAVFPLESRASALIERRERIRDEVELIRQYREVVEVIARAVIDMDESPRLSVLPFLVEKEEELSQLEQELTSIFGQRFLLAHGAVSAGRAAVLVVLRRDADEARGALGRQGLGELPRPMEYTGLNLRTMAYRMEKRAREAPEEMSAAEEGLRRMAEEEGAFVKGLMNRARDESARVRVLRETASGRYGFALFGWVPAGRKGNLVKGLDRIGPIEYAFQPVDEKEEAGRVPVLLENHAWVRPFEPLISFLNLPRYDGWDPTWVVAAFFPLWFGMIVGDLGYAAVFAGAAAFLSLYARSGRPLRIDFFKLRLSPGELSLLVRVMIPMIAWTAVWGGIYGEFFGDLFQRMGVFATPLYPEGIPVLIPRTETARTANLLILISIGFGTYQVLHGFYLRALLSRRQRQWKHFWEGVGYLGGVVTMVLFSYSFMTGDFRQSLILVMFVGTAVFLLGMFRAGMPLMAAELPTQGGHILSYIRIYAVGLASAILANLSTDMGFALYHYLGLMGLVVGLLTGIVMALLMHAALLILLTVSHVLQPIRLIWVEFFTKFDFYSLSGRPYRPFKSAGGSP